MHIKLLMEVLIEAQNTCPATNNSHRGLDRFGHNFAQLTRISVLAFAWNHGCFDRQQLATDFGPGKTGDLPYLVIVFSLAVSETTYAKVLLRAFGVIETRLSRGFNNKDLTTLRQILEISRSRFLTPDSRV